MTTPAMGGGADQDRHMADNHLYAALLDTGHDDAFDKDKAYRDIDVDNPDASVNSADEHHRLSECQIRPEFFCQDFKGRSYE